MEIHKQYARIRIAARRWLEKEALLNVAGITVREQTLYEVMTYIDNNQEKGYSGKTEETEAEKERRRGRLEYTLEYKGLLFEPLYRYLPLEVGDTIEVNLPSGKDRYTVIKLSGTLVEVKFTVGLSEFN